MSSNVEEALRESYIMHFKRLYEVLMVSCSSEGEVASLKRFMEGFTQLEKMHDKLQEQLDPQNYIVSAKR